MGAPKQTFLGVDGCDLARRLPAADVVLFGAADATPYDPGRTSHSATAPAAIRAALRGYEGDLSRWDFDQDGPLLDRRGITVLDAGEVPTDPGTPDRNRDAIRSAARGVLGAGAVPVLIGGDDSVPIPFIEAFEAVGSLTVLQIDAHLDWKDQRGGLRYTFASTMRRASEMPWVERIVQVGLRGIGGSGRPELDRARAWGAKIVTAREVREHGIQRALDFIEEGSNCLVTIDCDGLDPSVVPGVIIPQPGGLSYHDVVGLIEGAAARAKLVGFDLVELVPERDVGGLGALAAARIVCNAIGRIGRQRAAAARTTARDP